jgi:hypothetical protein
VPGKTPASKMLAHLYLGRIERDDGKAIDVLVDAMNVKHGMTAKVALKTLQWCVDAGLVRIHRNSEGACIIEVTDKYRPPR